MKIHEVIHLVKSGKYKYFYNGNAQSPFFFAIQDDNVWVKYDSVRQVYQLGEDIKTHLKGSTMYNRDVWEVSNKLRGSI